MADENKKPVIVGLVADLMINVRIERVVQQLGYQIRWIEQPDDLGPANSAVPQERPGEMLHGQGGALFASLADWQPVLLIFDLNNEAVPWREWIASIKSSPATRRIPVLAFGSHVETEILKAARAAGADQVVARSRFSSAMPQLIESQARKRDRDALQESCSQQLAELARQGIEMFNEGHFYKCHDFLEEAWVEDQSSGRDLYRGILQVGIAYFQIERGNYRGALKMLLRVRQWLDPLPDVCRGVDVARLREDVQNVHNRLLELGADRMAELDRSLFRQVRLV